MKRGENDWGSATSTVRTWSVKEILNKEVPDWDDDLLARARFKDFSGQKSEWLPKYNFWKDLIISIARHFNQIAIDPSQVKNEWFNRNGLTPLCIDEVFNLMCAEGYIARKVDMVDPTTFGISKLILRVKNLLGRAASTQAEAMAQDRLIVIPLVEERARQAIKCLSESHWTPHCVVSMARFQIACGGSFEANAVLSYLCGRGRAHYLSLRKGEIKEGVKVSLSEVPISSATSLDYSVLHLTCSSEKLTEQIAVIDRRYESAKQLALLSLKSGQKNLALRYGKEMKMISESRAKHAALLNRVDEVLDAIADSQTTKEVSEAIRMGTRATKKNAVTVEDVERCLSEVDDGIAYQKQFEEALNLSYRVDDDEVELELGELQADLDNEDGLSDALSNMKLQSASDENRVASNAKRAALELA